MGTSNYWKNREELKNKAELHTGYVADKYKVEIKECISKTEVYDTENPPIGAISYTDTTINVVDRDTVSAIMDTTDEDGKVAVLNFASYNNPGGKFIEGSSAQEESLCHESFLYNVLVDKEDTYYKWNNEHKNRGLYTNRALYSPDVIFERNGETRVVDVITCAAPNRSLLKRYGSFTDSENDIELKSRIKFIKNIAEEHNINTIILGAYGCGVFAQNPYNVASMFKEEFEKTSIANIIFAIPSGDNLRAFEEVFNNEAN